MSEGILIIDWRLLCKDLNTKLFQYGTKHGMVVGPIMGGAISDFSGINSGFYYGAMVTAIGIGLFIWFSR